MFGYRLQNLATSCNERKVEQLGKRGRQTDSDKTDSDRQIDRQTDQPTDRQTKRTNDRLTDRQRRSNIRLVLTKHSSFLPASGCHPVSKVCFFHRLPSP